VDYVLMPNYDELYADGFRYQVTETQFSEKLCGRNRPGHFTGVLTVVMKLLNIVSPQRAYFGKKDYQQYLLVQDMVQAFFMPVDIIGCDTVREIDGLAMSSRNLNLETSARKQAARFYEIISASLSDAEVRCQLDAAGFQVDYVESCHGRRFAAIVTQGKNSGQTVRLIDNVAIAS
jgi:pantoate--beta-alanine ligase